MAFHVTQCPGCDSTFNTSARLLESAAGKVRCGACLVVFEAAENFVTQHDADNTDPGEESVFVGNNPLDYFDPSSFLTRSALREDSSTMPESPADFIKLEQTPLEGSDAEQNHDIFTATVDGLPAPADPIALETLQQPMSIAAESPELSVPEFEAPEPTGEIVAVAAIEEVEPQEPVATRTQTPEDVTLEHAFTLPHSTLPEQDADASETEAAAETEPKESADTAEEPADLDLEADEFLDLVAAGIDTEATASFEWELQDDEFSLEEIDSSYDPELAAVASSEHSTTESIIQSTSKPIEEVDERVIGEDAAATEADSTAAIRARALESELHDEEALEALPQANLAALSKVSTPVEFTGSQQSRWGRQLIYAVVAVLLAGVLAAQFLWQRTEIYSQVVQLRPWYQWGCNYLACELPAYSNIGAIRSDNLVVRSHPEFNNALMVTITFRNTAMFPQAFPILILSFNTSTDDIVALREFAPSQYLDRALQNLTLMPVMSPFQVTLEIIDPGPDAVNYTLAFRRP